MRITAAFPHFWQQFPKAVEANGQHVRFGLFPREWNDLHELQGGERKTHTFWIDVRDVKSPQADLNWVFAPMQFQPTTQSCAEAQSVRGLILEASDSRDKFCGLLEEAIAGPDSFEARRDRVDEYGWRHFGDTFADHEQTHYPGTPPLVSHYNNQFDVLRGFLAPIIAYR